MDRTEYRENSLKTWNNLASAWDERRDEIGEPVTVVRDWLVEKLGAQPGETILDIACGAGELSEAVSPQVGDGGRVICTDFAAEMLAAARRRGEHLGLSNVEYRQMDAERMDLEDASVDGAMCRFGYMLMSDHVAALRETRRVVRADGRLVFAVWAQPMRNPWVLVPGSVLMERGHMPPPDPEGPGIFALGDPDRIAVALSAAGLTQIELGNLEVHNHISDREALWERVTRTMGPLATAIAQQTEDEQASIRTAVEERAEPYLRDDGYHLPGAVYAVLARPA